MSLGWHLQSTGLLPILWSTATGSEVAKPIATPVLGGMVSSLVHVLIVTPVIWTLLKERELVGRQRLELWTRGLKVRCSTN